jgi:hypothetical protein
VKENKKSQRLPPIVKQNIVSTTTSISDTTSTKDGSGGLNYFSKNKNYGGV